MKSILVKVLPPLWFCLFLGAALLLHEYHPATRVFDISSSMSIIAGVVIFTIGFALSMRASNIFALEKTEILPTSPSNKALVVRGPYRYSRNPMYLGLVIELLGIALYVGTLPMFVATAAMFAVVSLVFVPYEEEKLLRIFGEKYSAYKASVRRWL